MTHDELKEIIAQAYFTLPQLNCRFCKYKTPLPQQGVGTVVTEHQTRQFKADVAALSQQGETVAIIEVVNTHPPTTKVLQAQSELEAAFYVEMDALDNRFEGYCSPFCWTNRKENNVSPWKAPSCEICGRYYYTMEFQYELFDWEGLTGFCGTNCIECAARHDGCQWLSPGELALGVSEDRIPGPDADVLALFLSFENANFWAKVWTNRTMKLSEAWSAETATELRLNQAVDAFNKVNWNEGERLLQPIGAPAWDRPAGPPLFAWNRDNCVRTACAWRRLREHRLSCLPPMLQDAIRSRPPLPDVVLNPSPPVITHRGFPDGRFTDCGLDRTKTSELIIATMTDTPTCERCRG